MFKFAACAAALVVSLTAASAQTTLDLSLNEARGLASEALFAGDSALALDIARAILAQAPDDRGALLLVAAAAPQQGAAREGRLAGARAFAVSESDAQRYEAARLTALAAANEQRFTLGTFWLRRALIAAPSVEEREQTLSDARLLQQQNPWTFDVFASIAPSSNVNGGTSDDSVPEFAGLVGTLSDAALPQAGWRGRFGLNLAYRLRETAANRTVIGGQYQIDRVRITDDTDLPDDAFALDVAEVNLRHDQALQTGSITGQLSYGRITYRQLIEQETDTERKYYDSLRFGLDRRIPIGQTAEVTFSASRDITTYEEDRIGQIRRNSFGTSVATLLASGDLARIGVSYAKSDAGNINYRSEDWTLQGAYVFNEPVGPFTLGVSGGVTWSDYPEYRFLNPVPGRQDTNVFANLNIGFPQVSYAGFTPALTITASATDSNVSRFTRNALGAGFVIQSAF